MVGAGAGSEVVPGARIAGYVVEELRVLAQAKELVHVDASFARLVFMGLNQDRQAVGFRKWQRAEQNAIDDGKDRRVGTYAKREGQHRDTCEARRPAESA